MPRLLLPKLDFVRHRSTVKARICPTYSHVSASYEPAKRQYIIFAGIILDKMGGGGPRHCSQGSDANGASINWYALTDAFIEAALDVWFTNHLNYIPGLRVGHIAFL